MVFSVLCFIHPLPPMGYSHLSQGGRASYNRISPRQPIAPLRQVGRAKRRGWIVFTFPFSLFRSLNRRGWMFLAFPFNKPPSNVGNVVRSTNFSICGIKVTTIVTKSIKTVK